MGQYDNYSNEKNIAKAKKRLDKLTAKRNSDPYEVELARKEWETAKLFEKSLGQKVGERAFIIPMPTSCLVMIMRSSCSLIN